MLPQSPSCRGDRTVDFNGHGRHSRMKTLFLSPVKNPSLSHYSIEHEVPSSRCSRQDCQAPALSRRGWGGGGV